MFRYFDNSLIWHALFLKKLSIDELGMYDMFTGGELDNV